MSHLGNYYGGLGYSFGGFGGLGSGSGCGCGSFCRLGHGFVSSWGSFRRLGSGFRGYGFDCHRPMFYGGYGFSSFY